MKNLLFTFTLFLIVNFSFAQTKIENDLTKDSLKGKVSFYSESSYKLVEKFGEIEKGGEFFKHTYKFDEKGNMIEEITSKAYGNLNSKFTYKYDVKGNEIEVNTYVTDGTNKARACENINWRMKEKLGDNRFINNLAYCSYIDVKNFIKFKYSYKYDEKGNMIEQNSYNDDGSLCFKTKSKYDEKGNKIELIIYYTDGSLCCETTYKYDEKGNKIEQIIYYHENGNQSIETTYEYDEKGNMIEKYSYPSKMTYEYDEGGNVIEEDSYEYGDLSRKCTYKYEFDAMNNWIKLTSITKTVGVPKDITERVRVIKYY